MNMAELLREAGGQVDATGQLLKGYALQPVAGLGGVGRTMIDLLRGKGVDPSLAAGARTVEDIGGWGGGPMTERGQQRLGELGGMVERGTQAVSDALGNPLDRVHPAMAAGALGFMETANPVKGLGAATRAVKNAVNVPHAAGNMGPLPREPQVQLATMRAQRPFRQAAAPDYAPPEPRTPSMTPDELTRYLADLHAGRIGQSSDPKPLNYDPLQPGQALIPGIDPVDPVELQRQMLAQVLRREPSADPHTSVEAFLRAAQNEPSLLTYGTMPQNVPRGLDAMADAFSERSGKPINVEYTGDSYSDEPYKIKVEKTHGRGEVMRDQYGDIKEREKTHERGDYPMFDEHGDKKKYEVKGPPVKGEDMVKALRVARGGEPKRDSYGDQQYELIKSRGGETMYDERGNVKYTKEDNPDYQDEEEAGIRMSSGRGYIDISDYEDPKATNPHKTPVRMHATEASKGGGGIGTLLYQAALADASRSGKYIGTDGLTQDNQLRLLNNTLANYARTGINPRDVSGTRSGERPRARGYATGPEIWEALSGEADFRVRGKGADSERVQFTGTGFTIDGQPVAYGDIKRRAEELSPQFLDEYEGTQVGPKTLMQSAVYKWLERATPEEAEQAVKGWGSNVRGPIFGKARTDLLAAIAAGTGGAAMVNALRDDEKKDK